MGQTNDKIPDYLFEQPDLVVGIRTTEDGELVEPCTLNEIFFENMTGTIS